MLALQLALQPRDRGSRLTRLPCCCGGSGCVSCRLQEGDERSTFCSRCSSVFRSTSLLMTSRAGQSRVSPAEAQEGACGCSCRLVVSVFISGPAGPAGAQEGIHSCLHTQRKSSLLCCTNGCLINTLNECRIHALRRGCGGSIGRSPCAALIRIWPAPPARSPSTSLAGMSSIVNRTKVTHLAVRRQPV